MRRAVSTNIVETACGRRAIHPTFLAVAAIFTVRIARTSVIVIVIVIAVIPAVVVVTADAAVAAVAAASPVAVIGRLA